MLSKYRMEKANPGMEKARLTSRLNAVQQRINEVEEQLDEARRNAAFESKYKDDPYWKIAKKRYIETGDPAAIENFRSKQDALETAEKDRASRDEVNRLNKAKQELYDEADARKAIRLAQNALDAAEATQNQRQIADAKIELEHAKKHYKLVTGYDYEDVNKNVPNETDDPPAEEVNEWKISEIPNITEYVPDINNTSVDAVGKAIMQYTDKGGKRFKTEAEKRQMIDWLKSNDAARKQLSVDIDSLEARLSKEAKNANAAKKDAELLQLKKKWNVLLDKYQAAKNKAASASNDADKKAAEKAKKTLQKEMNDAHVLLRSKGAAPKNIFTKFSI